MAYGYSIEIDGNYGREVKKAVEDFQTRLGLQIDGQVGQVTIGELMKEPTERTMAKEIDYSLFHLSDESSKEAFMNSNSFFSDTGYFIVVNLKSKNVSIFEEVNGKWKLKKSFLSSIGATDTPTITGRYRVGIKGRYFGHENGYECRYYTQIRGNYLFHSILFELNGKVLDGRLGYEISHGCIRLAEADAKWIYDVIPQDTQILIK